jgi:hypothetical protein
VRTSVYPTAGKKASRKMPRRRTRWVFTSGLSGAPPAC